MKHRFLPLLIVTVLGLLALSGCGKPSYGNEQDYRNGRAAAYNVEATAGTEALAPDGTRFYVWPLRSGEAVADVLGADGFAVDRTIPFGSPDEATAYVATVGEEVTEPAIPPSTFLTDRATELGADSGSYLANGDGGAYYLWTMPDGTFTRDFVTLDGNSYVVAETNT